MSWCFLYTRTILSMTIATLETLQQPQDIPNPYFLDLDSLYANLLLENIVANYKPYADSTTNSDLGTKKIYLVNGDEYGSDLGRIAEAELMEKDPRWNQPRDVTMTDFAVIEDNSRFFLLVDDTDQGPELIGSLRVADCDKGPSETEKFFTDSFGKDVLIPEKMKSGKDQEGIWEIVLVVVKPEYQDGVHSAWLYYAMHKNSVDEGKKGWISNITDEEHKRLNRLGIPFEQIEGTDKVQVQSREDADPVSLGFYYTPLDIVADSVDARAEKFENREGAAAIIGKLALIARFGSFARPKSVDQKKLAS